MFPHITQMRFDDSFSNIGDVEFFNKLARQIKSQPLTVLATYQTFEDTWIF